jgi:acetyl-CoA carboxylase alpha subunit
VSAAAAEIKSVLVEQIDRLCSEDINTLLQRRYKRLMNYGTDI